LIRSGVAVAHLLFAEGAVDPAGNRVPEPDDGSEQENGEGELQCFGHESTP
jgi:hypothetical protein